jgi:mRNA-degrading endonuclease YafQ of YafQ-DinJ toxin-antitoxin module
MPTYELKPLFQQDLKRLTPEQYKLFKKAVNKMVEDIKAKRPFRPGLRAKRFQSIEGAYEMSWAPDGRAIFTYGTSPQPGDTHIIWLRVGTHAIFEEK